MEYLSINYIGNKQRLLEWIFDKFPKNVKSVFDCFAGGGSVSYGAKKRGYDVYSNDILKINSCIGQGLIKNNEVQITIRDIDFIFSGRPFEGFVTRNYAERFFYKEECKELDLYMENIRKIKCETKRALILTILRNAILRKIPYSRFNLVWGSIKKDREMLKEKPNTLELDLGLPAKKVFVNDFYNKSFKHHFLDCYRKYNKVVFKANTKVEIYNEDVFSIVEKIKADVIYLDPPYVNTSCDYFKYYGFLDSYIKGEKLKRFENAFMSKVGAVNLFDKLFSKLGKYKYWVISYTDKATPNKVEFEHLLKKHHGEFEYYEKEFNYRFFSKNKSKEVLYLVRNKRYKRG